MNNVFFSVIIPTFNRAEFLKKAIESVYNQTFKNFELIVIDSYSTDKTDQIIQEFENIIYKKINKKGNISASRNLGIKSSKGKWIAFLDSDDIWSKDKLQFVFDVIKKNNSNVYCNSEWIINNNQKSRNKIWHYGPYRKNFYESLLRYGNRLSTSATVVEKDFLIKNNLNFNETGDFNLNEDFDFFLNLARLKANFKFIYFPLGTHVFNATSVMSKNVQKRKEDLLKVLELHTYKLQNFSQNKDDLWHDINVYLSLKENIIKFKKFDINTKIFKDTFILSLKNPKILIIILYQFIRLRLFQIKYFFYK